MTKCLAAFALFLSTALIRPAAAEVGDPVYHGALDVSPVAGRIDPETGVAALSINGWLFLPTPDSNGVFPDREDVVVALGEDDNENRFTIPAGLVSASRSGKRFSYRTKLDRRSPGIRSLRLTLRPDGWYRIRLRVQGLDIPRLLTQDPVCLPMALIVGDDDGFSGVDLTRRNFTTARLRVRGACQSETSWPWV